MRAMISTKITSKIIIILNLYHINLKNKANLWITKMKHIQTQLTIFTAMIVFGLLIVAFLAWLDKPKGQIGEGIMTDVSSN